MIHYPLHRYVVRGRLTAYAYEHHGIVTETCADEVEVLWMEVRSNHPHVAAGEVATLVCRITGSWTGWEWTDGPVVERIADAEPPADDRPARPRVTVRRSNDAGAI